MDVIYENLRGKIRFKEIPDSEIIRDVECAKREYPRFDINYVGYMSWTSLIRAVLWNRKELVKYILADSNIDVNHKDNDGYTAFYYACWFCGYIPILKLFLDHRNFDVNIQTKWGQTGLHSLCYWERETCVRELLLDARINVLIRDDWRKTARDIALERKHIGIANMIKKTGYTPLLRIPNASLCRDIVRMIIEEYV